MRVLLTGASGFIGAHLAARLHGAGHGLFVLPSPHFRSARLAGIGYQVVANAAEARADLVYHLAGTPMTDAIAIHTHEDVLVGGTRRLLDQLRLQAPRRLVMTGSAAEYGSGHGWREDDTPRPDTAFGRLKRAAAGLVCASRIASVHLRVFTPFGEGEAATRLVASVARAARSGQPVRLTSDGLQTRDYIYVSDLVDALVEAGQRPLEAGIAINVCSGVERRVIDVARRIVELAGGRHPVEPGPTPVAALTQSSGNGERAERLLGWRPRIDLDEGLRRALHALSQAMEQTTR